MKDNYIQMKDVITDREMENAKKREALAAAAAIAAMPKPKDVMEDVIKLGEFPCDRGFELAATKCCVPWGKENSKLLATQFKNIHVSTEPIDPSSIFFVVCHFGCYSAPAIIHSLCLGDLIVFSEGTEFSTDSVKFQSGSIYKRTSNPRHCKKCHRSNCKWEAIVTKTNFQLTLDQKAIDVIKAACLHWHEYFHINENRNLGLQNVSSSQFQRYKSRHSLFVRNLSSDSLTELENVVHPGCPWVAEAGYRSSPPQ